MTPDFLTVHFVADVVSLLLLTLGSVFILSAAIGVLRFGDTMSRVHAITKPQTTGLILAIIGTAIRVTGSDDFSIAERSDLGVLALLVLFALMTTPVTAQRLGRISRREGLYGDIERMSRNDAPAPRSLRRK
ncbi:monovalent cation/H(+) antiporter subunit G [Corynebacterium uterequi]|uniref:Multisubunit Na+/H+ antiporter, MnhG subunit n=1 Tax=Corynebacterium uterequi TaxID=1072256 RepID=A0A0G3HGL3_9CORY|nr:monovalent cation/H(+) antiporter subunit G [Corynebacterium uterequi]AKK11900.1 multisubunit Na+/H+ antiporter, MnhG subunit [Corynebacterium uterequi]